jgi:hypothetical protein
LNKISIIIPIMRWDKAAKCVDAIDRNAGIPADQYEVLTAIDHDKIGCPKMVERLVSSSKHDLVMFLGDDTIPEKDFLKHALDAMEILPDGWGVVGLNTQDINQPNGNPLAHWMAHKNMLDHIPGNQFFPTDYEHCFCDNELKEIAEEMGRWVYAEKSLITHNHPVNKTAEYDGGYQLAYDDGKWQRDHRTYCRRKRARMAARYGTKLAICVPLTDQWIYTQFFFSFVKVITEYTSSLVNAGKPISFDVFMPRFPCQVDAARNDLVRQALETGCTHILMMDTDQIYQSTGMIEKMLSHDKPVVGARVHRRYAPFDPLLLEGELGKLRQIPDERIRPKGGDFVDELEVDYTGTGCILYDTSIFIDMMPEKWFEFKVGENGQAVGEDINFCDKLKRQGYKIVVDCGIDIKHLTLMATDWSTYKLFSKIMEGGKNGVRK